MGIIIVSPYSLVAITELLVCNLPRLLFNSATVQKEKKTTTGT